MDFSIFSIFMFLPYIFVIAVFGIVFFKIISTARTNQQMPRLTVDARVVGKRPSTSHHTHNNGMVNGNATMTTSSSTSYYVTFEFDNKERYEMHVPASDYSMMAEGDIGKLTLQGSKFIHFDREF